MGDLNERMTELRRLIPKDVYGLTTDQGDDGMLNIFRGEQVSSGDSSTVSQSEVTQKSDPIKSDAERLAEARELLAQVLRSEISTEESQ